MENITKARSYQQDHYLHIMIIYFDYLSTKLFFMLVKASLLFVNKYELSTKQ